ncbi:hypothetical protein [uncultured Sunxiuqinia sp.]|uniref:hypothetical protein n=1 Tax=uncultured Sunxiuqinia sp. TaxID=1573825 RepID=UPI0026048E7F|nr:hypothetical protein [uncultured Sunxiuqinia sp.]
MLNKKQRKTLRNMLMGLLVVIFLALVIALTNLIPGNPLTEYRLVLGLSFIVVAALARTICVSCREESAPEQ